MVREDAEGLRRRLYAPGASSDDVARYRAAEPSARAVADRPAPLLLPRRRPRLVPVLVAALVLLAAVAAIAVMRTAAPPLPAPTPVAMSADDRQEALGHLADGDGGGIAAFLVTHRSPPGLAGATRYFTIERAGSGDAVVDLSPVDAATVRGRATVLLVADRTADVRWTTSRAAGAGSALVTQRRAGGVQEAGVITADTFRYGEGDRPVRVRVEAPADVRWGVAVVFTD